MGRKSERPKAYSYLRFSTPEQAAGDSRRRQTDHAVDYARKHGLDLDDNSYSDLGISAYRGKNAATGALRQFLEAVEDGVVPQGSFLLVENLDRLTRNSIVPAQALFLQILSAGITIVTLIDQRSYSEASVNANPTDLIISLLSMMNAHDESAKKARRLREAWSEKRRAAAELPLTARGPAWLRLDRSKTPPRWIVIHDRAKIVKRIFRLAAKGVGQHAIAEKLNEQRVPTFGDGKQKGKMWHRSTVKKILESEAVVGVFIPHTMTESVSRRKVRTPGEPVNGYFPQIVDDQLFDNVRAMRLAGHRQPSTKGSRPAHMLSGLARCGLCGAAMTRVYKGAKGGKPKLVCTAAKIRAGCEYRTVRVEDVERTITEKISQLVATAPLGDESLDTELERLEVVRAAIDDMLSNVVDSIATGNDSTTLRERLRSLETDREKTDKDYDALVEKIAAVSRASVERRLDALERLVENGADVAEISAVMRQAVRSVVVDRKDGCLRFAWAHGGESELVFAWPIEDTEA